MANNAAFHRATIRNRNFYATLSADGPYIGCKETRGGVAIGHCTSLVKVEDKSSVSGRSYAVCKYRTQVRIMLSGLTDQDVQQLSEEFGIPVENPLADTNKSFRESAAFKGLVAWAREHPRLFARYRRHQSYVTWALMVDEELQATEA